MINVFVTYSWDSQEHKDWVGKLASALDEQTDIHVVLDQFDLLNDMDKNAFMEEAITTSQFVIVVASRGYEAKANARKGGVGIETSMNAERSWRQLASTGRSNTVVVLREKDSTPRYLKQQFHVDFTDDATWNKSVAELLRTVRSQPMLARPAKAEKPETRGYDLTKVSKLIALNSKKRQELISAKEAADYAGLNRIKFELWETSTPAKNHILALHNNVNISQSLERAAELMSAQKIQPTYLTILRTRPKSKSAPLPASPVWRKVMAVAHIEDTNYKSYIWEYCIDGSFKEAVAPDSIEFYTEQDISDSSQTHGTAVSHLSRMLTADNGCTPILVRGSGGIGKTSLCTSLVSALIRESSDRYVTFFIRSEDIRRQNEVLENSNIEADSVYELYRMQAAYLNQENILDRDVFELSILSGNLIIVIDGLDELPSIFKQKFSVKRLLESIRELELELGYGRILITSRPNVIPSDDEFQSGDISIFDLLGFDEIHCKRYLAKRFRNHKHAESVTKKILQQAQQTPLADDERVLPFFIDVLSCVYEDAYTTESDTFAVSFEPTPYNSLNEVTDHIIHSIFVRECTRHDFSIPVVDLVFIFNSLTHDHGGKWPLRALEEIVGILHEKNSEEIIQFIKKNPLVVTNEEYVRLKYDFLTPYFNTLTLLDGFGRDSKDIGFITALARVTIDSNEFKDLVRYFRSGKNNFIGAARGAVAYLIGKLRETRNEERLPKAGIVAALENMNLLISMMAGNTKEAFSDAIKEIYQITDQSLTFLYLKGELPPFDFSHMSISDSRFKSYRRFLESEFTGAKFTNCVFEGCRNDLIKHSNVLVAEVDFASCSLGDLAESLKMLEGTAAKNEELLAREINRFFSNFYKGGNFRELHPRHIAFSTFFDGLGKNNLTKLVSKNFLYLKAEKEIGSFFAVTQSMHGSIQRFLNNGYKDAQMNDFFDYVRGS